VNETFRLLYAEDNLSDGDLTREYLATHAPHIQLEIVGTGGACLDRLQHGQYDVLLLDNHLPDMDAVDVLKELAARKVAMPVVVATAVGDEDLVVRVLRLGAWDYVPKQGHYIETLPSILGQAIAEHRRLRDRGHAARRRQRRILYIERHPADIDLTIRYLGENAPHLQLDIVRSSKEALALLHATFDLVLTDLRMPDMNALDLLREVRHRSLPVPVVVVTGKGDEVAAVAALKLGAYDYIVKRDDYLTQLPYALDNAIDRFQLAQVNERLQAELADRERAEAERVHLAKQLQQAQKIDSLGRLAGGVAHDFNNLLTVIGGHADLMLQQLEKSDPLRESVNDIRLAATRATDLTRQLLAFSRRQLLDARVLDLNASIRESTKMLRRLLSENVELATVLEPNVWRVKADPGQLDQVLVNLAVNARDAMPRGGRLTIETHNVTIDDREAQRHASFPPGAYVLLAVSDTGIGIDKEILPHIFEPFFTTKEAGQGTGLGLSMVYGIVKQSGGWIWASSEMGHGTTFKIYLPRVDAPITFVQPSTEPESPRGTETVLVVEDEETVRRLTSHILRRHGYDVIEASNGGEALLACERHVVPIPLVITDVVMPGMSGPELAARLKKLHPEMKALYTSGYADAAVVEHGLREGMTSFLQKPFTAGELTRKVRDMLDDPGPPGSAPRSGET
jgi:signal transduction histidine kinase